MNQQKLITGLVALGVLMWISTALIVSGNMDIIPIFDGMNETGYNGIHDTNHEEESGHHGMMGMMGHADHEAEDCDEHDDYGDEDYECEYHENYEDSCHQAVNNTNC
ncbi:MAG: hypothetical protein ACW964_11980 [Candidatus Hodarchaeales archaeon]|jgi:hypothetical protein